MKKLQGDLRFKKKMMKNPLISIITVVFNAEKTIKKTIESVINQTYKNIEYIIIDGNSSDKTTTIIKRYDLKIDCWISEPDKGIYDAMNKGLHLAKGEYVYFLNADDYLIGNNVLEKVSKILENKSPGMLYGQIKSLSGLYPQKDITSSVVAGYKTFPHQALFMSTDLIKKTGIFNLDYRVVADRDLIYRSIDFKPLIVFSKIPIAFFSHLGASSQLHLKENLKVAYTNFGLRPIPYYLFIENTKDIILRVLSFFEILDYAKSVKARLQKLIS